MKCKDCEYCSGPIDRLNNKNQQKGFENRTDWGHCIFPRTYQLDDKAILMEEEQDCVAFIPKYNEGVFDEHMKPYEGGRDLEEKEIKILELLTRAKLNICVMLSKEKDMEYIEKTQRLISDLSILIHIWKKEPGSI